MIKARTRKLGFTLVELLTVMAISGILLGISAPSMSKYSADKQLAQAAELVSQTIYDAKTKAQAPPQSATNDYRSGYFNRVSFFTDNTQNNSITTQLAGANAGPIKKILLPGGVVVRQVNDITGAQSPIPSPVPITFNVGLGFSAAVNGNNAITKCRIVLHSLRTGNEKYVDFYVLTGMTEIINP